MVTISRLTPMNRKAFLCCTDNNYAPHAGSCLFSLLLSTPDRNFDIHILTINLDTPNLERFRILANLFKVNILIHEAARHLDNFRDSINDISQNRSEHINDTSLIRLLYDKIVEQDYDIITYIDCDIIFLNDATHLLNASPHPFTLAASRDLISNLRQDPGEASGHPYFNAGVLVINDRQWRSQNASEALLKVTRSVDLKGLQYADQDLLNLHFRQQGYQLLPDAFNYQYMASIHTVLQPQAVPLRQAIAIHFAGEIKPWHAWGPRPFAEIYERHRLLSPWGEGYAPETPTSLRQLQVGFASLRNQQRFEEACAYAARLMETPFS